MPDASKLFTQYFPKGIEQQQSLTEDLCTALDSRYSYGVVADNYVFVLSCLFEDEDSSSEAIIHKVQNRPNNKLSESDIRTIYRYAILNNEYLSENNFLVYIDKLCEKGSSEDMMPEGYGEFGLDITNPIPIHGIPENEKYLSMLRLKDGSEIFWIRLGSCKSDNISSIIDEYLIFDSEGDKVCHLYLCPYNRKTSRKAPKGFFLEEESIWGCRT